MKSSCQGVRSVQLELYRFLFRVTAQFGLQVEVVLLDTELKMIPFFAATAVFRILQVKAGKQLRFDGLVRELYNGFVQGVTLVGGRFEERHFAAAADGITCIRVRVITEARTDCVQRGCAQDHTRRPERSLTTVVQ